ncbi:myosin light chain kinase family member 4 isoform X2 [Pleurodeles waltl]|uniref:myosin light chain kinase family member 4 isoform X2 n=1 Tax=Pleurodeles waltl TaxID=8319 RepID=UPI0037093FC1
MSTPGRKVSTSSLVNSLAKRFDPRALQHQGPATPTDEASLSLHPLQADGPTENSSDMHRKFDFLSHKIDQLLTVQDNVLQKLDHVCHDVDGIAKIVTSRTEKVAPDPASTGIEDILETKELCLEMNQTLSEMNKCTEQQIKRLDGVEHVVLGIQQFIRFLTAKLKTSKIAELLLKGPEVPRPKPVKQRKNGKTDRTKISCAGRALSDRKNYLPKKRKEKVTRDHKVKEKKEKSYLVLKGTQSVKKKKTPDSADDADEHILHKDEDARSGTFNAIHEEDEKFIEKPSEEGEEKSGDEEDELEEDAEEQESVEDGDKTTELDQAECELSATPAPEEESESVLVSDENEHCKASLQEDQDHIADADEEETASSSSADDKDQELNSPAVPVAGHTQKNCTVLLERYEDSDQEPGMLLIVDKNEDKDLTQSPEQGCLLEHSSAGSSKRRVTEEDPIKDDTKKSRVDLEPTGADSSTEKVTELNQTVSIPVEESQEDDVTEVQQEDLPTEDTDTRLLIVERPAPSAPFEHRIVSARHAQINNYYTVNRCEILGGGRFGQVHMCTENVSGLVLAAKVIKAKFLKQKEEVKNEIHVMNQLNHSNLIQLYDAFESKHDIVLVMEYVGGGELFDRIIDESYELTEMDTILFIKQICEGTQYMHQMYIIHLDLKPENILCVNRATNQIKIIDFGLARRYKPREKLKVHFGTPEFLAPEVVNYEFVSFPTDMWSIGVIAYMLISGLSPFMGEDDNETMNNIICCRWGFENEEFHNVSEDAKDFITKLLIKDKSWRLSAKESLKHSWLCDPELHCRLSLQRKTKSKAVSQAPLSQ